MLANTINLIIYKSISAFQSHDKMIVNSGIPAKFVQPDGLQ